MPTRLRVGAYTYLSPSPFLNVLAALLPLVVVFLPPLVVSAASSLGVWREQLAATGI